MGNDKKQRKNNWLLTGVTIVCAAVFIYAAFQLYLIFSDYKVASDEYESLSEQVLNVTEIEEVEEIVEEEKEVNILDLPYEYEIPDYEVDLDAVKAQNSDAVGWIILPNTKLNYPIVHSKDNTEYLTTTFEGKTSSSGAIFLDMYCPADFQCDNAIIYGHNMKNGSMFRALNNMTDKEYFWRHHTFCIDLGNGFEEYEIISCYQTVETDLSSWQIGFASLEEYEQWLKDIVKRCNYKECMPYDATKKTITLSTCRGQSGGPGRFIVHLQRK